jgi:hypothetical protein
MGRFKRPIVRGILLDIDHHDHCVYPDVQHIVCLSFRVHDVPAQGFGYLMSMNAAMVVLFQYSIARWIKNSPQC